MPTGRDYDAPMSPRRRPAHPGEPHDGGLAERLNWLRAGVLGANDGIVSTAAVIIGVAGASTALSPILLAGLAALVGGAISMALGEYVSVSSQRDTERSLIDKERTELATDPKAELAELAQLYVDRGLSEETARTVATELTAHDALAAHLEAELNLEADDVVSPWRAAAASAVSFTLGGLLPLLTMLLLPDPAKIIGTFTAVLLALGATGYVASWIGGASPSRAMIRTVIGGALALGATFALGSALGTGVG